MPVPGPSRAAARVIAEDRVMVNMVTAYERVRFTLTDRALEADWPVPLLGVIPVRRVRRRFPLETIRSVRLVPVVFPSRFVVVVALALLPIVFALPVAVAAFTGLLAVLFLLLSVVAAVEIVTDERTSTIPVCALQRRNVSEFIAAVRATLPDGGGA